VIEEWSLMIKQLLGAARQHKESAIRRLGLAA